MYQPLEYVYVAVNADVDVIAAVAARDVPALIVTKNAPKKAIHARAEVSHLRHQHVLATHEVLFNVPHLVGDVDHDGGMRARRLQIVRVPVQDVTKIQ